VIYYYIDKYMNLGCTSSSRSESYHLVLRVITNSQLSLKQSVKRLINTIISLLKALDLDEDSSERDRPRRL
jgi:hypothetical protein